jgi:hypothetical protein
METAGRGSRAPCLREMVFLCRRLSPLAVLRGFIRPNGSEWCRGKGGQILAAPAVETKPCRSKRHRVSAPSWCPLRYRRLISPDRSGRNRTRSSLPLPPFPSSSAIPFRMRASARGMSAANFAVAPRALAEALAPRLARRKLPDLKESHLSLALQPDPPDVSGAAAPRTVGLVSLPHPARTRAGGRVERPPIRATSRHGSMLGVRLCVLRPHVLLGSWHFVQDDSVSERGPVSSHHRLNTLFPDTGTPRLSSPLRHQESNQSSPHRQRPRNCLSFCEGFRVAEDFVRIVGARSISPSMPAPISVEDIGLGRVAGAIGLVQPAQSAAKNAVHGRRYWRPILGIAI